MKLVRSLRHVVFNNFSKRSKGRFYDKKIFPNDLTLSEKIISTQSTAFNSSTFAPFFTLLCATKATPLKKLCYFKLAIVKTRNWLSAIRNKMEGTMRQSNKRTFSLSLFHSYYRPFILSNKSSIPSLWSLYSPAPSPTHPHVPFCIVLESAATDMDIGSLLQKNDELLINRERSSRQTFHIYIYFSLHFCILT